MDQQKIGSFLKELRKEKQMTQEQLAEKFHVSSRTVSRWETGVNMPDISILVELADFYDVSIPELIDGERKSEDMDPEVKKTAVKMAEYGKAAEKEKRKETVGAMLSVFSIIGIVSALAIFPRDSSWGSIYATLGGILLLVGIGMLLKKRIGSRAKRALCVAGCAVILAAVFLLTDYLGVAFYQQPPRFCYSKEYIADTEGRETLIYRTPFYNVIRENPDSASETWKIVKK